MNEKTKSNYIALPETKDTALSLPFSLRSLHIRGAYDDPVAAPGADVSPTNNADVRVKYAHDDSDDDDGDDNDDSAFVTANDVSVEPLESSRKLSFSSPTVDKVGIDDFISPILSRLFLLLLLLW